MLYLDYLVKMYYCKYGTFEGITETSFGNDLVSAFNNSPVKDLNDYLFSLVGYSTTNSYKLSDIVAERKEFCYSSNKRNYINALKEKYNVSVRSELSEVLFDIGALGIQKRPINQITPDLNLTVPRKFLNKESCELLLLVSSYLDNSGFTNLDCVRLKSICVVNSNPCELLEKVRPDFYKMLSVKFVEGLKEPSIRDGVLYTAPLAMEISEEDCRDYLIILYALGMPKLPLYARNNFLVALPKLVNFCDVDNSLLEALDVSYLTGYTVDSLMNIFGYSIPDPAEMFNVSGGFFCYKEGYVYYTNSKINRLCKIPQERFLELLNSGQLLSMDVQSLCLIEDMSRLEQSNVFGKGR